MGQYHYIVNIDKKQYLHPHKFDDGLKLMEFGHSSSGTMLALAVLLADSNGRGGGDLRVPEGVDASLVGSWAGDRIVIAGDYGDQGRLYGIEPSAKDSEMMRPDRINLYDLCCSDPQFIDISLSVRIMLDECGEWLRGQ